MAPGKVGMGEMEVLKVAGEDNIADALTKAVEGIKLTKHINLTKQVITSGRHQLSPATETNQ